MSVNYLGSPYRVGYGGKVAEEFQRLITVFLDACLSSLTQFNVFFIVPSRIVRTMYRWANGGGRSGIQFLCKDYLDMIEVSVDCQWSTWIKQWRVFGDHNLSGLGKR